MAWLIDGFNLLHAVESLARRLREEGPARASRELAAVLGRWSALDPKRNRVVLVLDGGPGNLDPVPGAPGLTVKFRAHADALILEELSRTEQSHVLVSRDRELVSAARKGGYHDTEDPLRFWRRLVDDLAAVREEVEKQRTPRPEEVAAWAALFGTVRAPAVPPPGPEPTLPPPASPSPSARNGSLASPPAASRRGARARPLPPNARPVGEPGKDRPLTPEEVQEWLDWFREPPRS